MGNSTSVKHYVVFTRWYQFQLLQTNSKMHLVVFVYAMIDQNYTMHERSKHLIWQNKTFCMTGSSVSPADLTCTREMHSYQTYPVKKDNPWCAKGHDNTQLERSDQTDLSEHLWSDFVFRICYRSVFLIVPIFRGICLEAEASRISCVPVQVQTCLLWALSSLQHASKMYTISVKAIEIKPFIWECFRRLIYIQVHFKPCF